jgi:PTS system nitrogen regulatory IIA component
MLSLADVAHHLDLPEGTIRRWVRQGRIPVVRQGDELLFDRRELEAWAREHQIRFIQRPRRDEHESTPQLSLARALEHGGAFRCSTCTDAESTLATLAEHASIDPKHRPRLLELLREREELSSTGIGRGVAVPHPRRPMGNAVTRASVVCAVLDEPIDFRAVDGEPVGAFFLLLSPSTREHLKLLSRLAYCLRDRGFIETVRQQPDTAELVAQIRRIEADLATTPSP